MGETIDILKLVTSLIDVFLFTLLGLYLTMKIRTMNVFDKMHKLYRELSDLKCQSSTVNELANLQLQLKHLLLEINDSYKWRFVVLTQSQNRLMADCCEEFLYFNEANKYWKKCFSFKFCIKEVESEYHRRYGQFLYHICDFDNGTIEFKKALKLPNDNDGRKYINVFTCIEWALCTEILLKKRLDQKERFESVKDKIADRFEMAIQIKDTISNVTMKETTGKKIDKEVEHYPWLKGYLLTRMGKVNKNLQHN